jgi:hypothetical protein
MSYMNGINQEGLECGPDVAAHVLWHFGRGGYRPGSFIEALLAAFAKADSHNFMRLEMAYPEYGQAMFVAKETIGGIDALEKVLKG